MAAAIPKGPARCDHRAWDAGIPRGATPALRHPVDKEPST